MTLEVEAGVGEEEEEEGAEADVPDFGDGLEELGVEEDGKAAEGGEAGRNAKLHED